MYLYLVTCVHKGIVSNEIYKVYVVAENSYMASDGALNLMRELQYKFTDYVERIDVLASVNTYRANSLLVIVP